MKALTHPIGSKCRRAALATAMFAAVLAGNAWADAYLNPVGGTGGSQFKARCPNGQLLTGFELRTASDVDAIRPMCVTAYGPREVSPVSVTGGWFGGTGGSLTRIVCPADAPVVIAMDVVAEGVDTVIVNKIALYCGVATAGSQIASHYPAAVFSGPVYQPSEPALGFGVRGDPASSKGALGSCPDGQVGVGVHGFSGIWVDAIGLICDVPRLGIAPVKSIGKAGGPATPGPRRSICDQARDARARNSPAARDLEAQCRASTPPVGSIGRTSAPSTPDPSLSLCDRAKDARARNSSAAANLEAQCLASQRPVSSIGRVGTPSTPGPALSICDRAQDARARNSPAAPDLEAQCRAAGGPGSTAPPPAAPPPEEPLAPIEFSPPLFDDGTPIWACADAAEANAGGCSGSAAAQAYCQSIGYPAGVALDAEGQPALATTDAEPGSPVRAVNGDACPDDTCRVVSQVQCNR